MAQLNKHPILWDIYNLTQAIESLGASPELTAVVVKASNLMDKAGKLVDEYYNERHAASTAATSEHVKNCQIVSLEAQLARCKVAHDLYVKNLEENAALKREIEQLSTSGVNADLYKRNKEYLRDLTKAENECERLMKALKEERKRRWITDSTEGESFTYYMIVDPGVKYTVYSRSGTWFTTLKIDSVEQWTRQAKSRDEAMEFAHLDNKEPALSQPSETKHSELTAKESCEGKDERLATLESENRKLREFYEASKALDAAQETYNKAEASIDFQILEGDERDTPSSKTAEECEHSFPFISDGLEPGIGKCEKCGGTMVIYTADEIAKLRNETIEECAMVADKAREFFREKEQRSGIPIRASYAAESIGSNIRALSAQAQPSTAEEMYYLQDTRQCVGNCMLFWGKNDNGYTCHLKNAQTYTKEQAFAQHKMRSSDKPWKVSDIQKIASLMVDVQYAHRIEQAADRSDAPKGNGAA